MRAGGEFYILDTKIRLSSCLRVSPLSANDERELTEPETSVGVTLALIGPYSPPPVSPYLCNTQLKPDYMEHLEHSVLTQYEVCS